MNFVTTNIRIPEEDYMDLKMEAAKKRVSVAHIVRERIAKKNKLSNKPSTKKLLHDIKKFAKGMSKKYPNLRLSKKVIEMRYEQ